MQLGQLFLNGGNLHIVPVFRFEHRYLPKRLCFFPIVLSGSHLVHNKSRKLDSRKKTTMAAAGINTVSIILDPRKITYNMMAVNNWLFTLIVITPIGICSILLFQILFAGCGAGKHFFSLGRQGNIMIKDAMYDNGVICFIVVSQCT